MHGEVKREMQATHDLGVSQIWIQLDLQSPDLADAWRMVKTSWHRRPGTKVTRRIHCRLQRQHPFRH